MRVEEVADRLVERCASARRRRARARSARRLKRTISPSMFQNAGRSRFEALREHAAEAALLHSIPAAGICAENDMSAGAVGDAELGEQGGEPRIGALVEDAESRCRRRGSQPSSVTSTVWVWPPKWSAASNSVTRRAARAPGARPRARRCRRRRRRSVSSPGCGRGRGRRGGRPPEERRESPSAPGGTREGGGRRRTPGDFSRHRRPAPRRKPARRARRRAPATVVDGCGVRLRARRNLSDAPGPEFPIFAKSA